MKAVTDESVKKTLFDKYFTGDVKKLNEFYEDVNAHIIPNLVKQAVEQAAEESKKTLIEENKGKSKAASSLKPEPKEESKSASIVPNNVNEVLKISKMFEGGL